MMNEKRDAIAARIRALLAKTTANGCTEEEAMAAARKAGELMDKFGLSMTELEVKQEKVGTLKKEWRTRIHDVNRCASAVARFCNCESWYQSGNGYSAITFLGLEHDVATAHYLVSLIRVAMDDEWRRYQGSAAAARDKYHGIHGRSARTDFMRAMASRVSRRLYDMAAERSQTAQTSDGRALTVVKDAMVKAAFERMQAGGFKLRMVSQSERRTASAGAAQAGREAGDRVALNPGIGQRTAGAIGR